MPCRATQDRRVMVESSDKMWPTGEGNGKPLYYSCLENPRKRKGKKERLQELVMDREAWHAAVHGVAKSRIRLNDCQAGPPGFRIGEELMLRLKLQYFGHLMQRTDSLGKNPDAGKD